MTVTSGSAVRMQLRLLTERRGFFIEHGDSGKGANYRVERGRRDDKAVNLEGAVR